jgi:hypothetical protein
MISPILFFPQITAAEPPLPPHQEKEGHIFQHRHLRMYFKLLNLTLFHQVAQNTSIYFYIFR